MSRLKRIKLSSGVINSLKSETDDGMSSCSNFREILTQEELEMDKLVLRGIDHVKRKITNEKLEAIEDVLDRNQNVFSRHKANIGCCNFVEHEIELEE